MCVARRSDKVILASHVHTSDKSYDFAEKVKQTLNSPGWATVTTNRISLEDGGYLFFVLLDEVCLLRPNAWVPTFFLAADFFVSPPPRFSPSTALHRTAARLSTPPRLLPTNLIPWACAGRARVHSCCHAQLPLPLCVL